MCDAIAIQLSEVPIHLHDANRNRVYLRENVPEFRFSYLERKPVLPVIHNGCLTIERWGSKSAADQLPKGGWCDIDQLKTGRWRWLEPAEILIPANFGHQSGRWFLIESAGIRGVLAQDARGEPHVYMLTQKSTHYYKIMTRSERQPVLIGEQI